MTSPASSILWPGRKPAITGSGSMRRSFLFSLWLALVPMLHSENAAPPAPSGAGGGQADVIRETSKQFKEGSALLMAGDNQAIASEAMYEANLKAKKNIVEMKANTFLGLWNNPAFAAQFEKFLAAPPETSDDYKTYVQRIQTILDLTSPGAGGMTAVSNRDQAFNLLPKASEFESDSDLCRAIHDAVYTASMAKVEIQNLVSQKSKAEADLDTQLHNKLVAADRFSDKVQNTMVTTNIDRAMVTAALKDQQEGLEQGYNDKVSGLRQTIQNYKTQIEFKEAHARFQLQALILQLFVQRRYQHVLILNRFYRSVFNDGDQSLDQFNQIASEMEYNKDVGQAKMNLKADPVVASAAGAGADHLRTGASAGAGSNASGANAGVGSGGMDAMALSGSGLKFGIDNLSVESAQNGLTTAMRTVSRTFKSLSQIDSLASEIIRDVNEGVKVYRYYLERNEVERAATQMASLFTKGEYLPKVRMLTQEEKRKTLEYAELCNRLVNASSAGNIEMIASTTAEIKKMNPTFDDSEIQSRLQAVRNASSLFISAAKVAASKGDSQQTKAELSRASALWPNNPEVTGFSAELAKMAAEASPQVQALADFDQLHSQGNYRQIFNEKEKYIAAVAADTSAKKGEHQARLRQVLDQMQEIEACVMRSQELAKRGDYVGAWEGFEEVAGKYPNDLKLVQERSGFAGKVADFIKGVECAKSKEGAKDYASALAWYLQILADHPLSDLAKKGVERTSKLLMEGSS